ncbi:MAG: mevalonate kinase [Methanomethylovorans sp.]|uniref:mevalonate kinase n=1 Tax=Methanomethylovorans sp. TaxID=2758717 RepID=UPI000AC5641D|nr:mevalonate kinase [Methanomethylovorans sp.]
MQAITCSAPGKIYLFGEHAVVYGESAICCAVDLRTRVQASSNDTILISSDQGDTGLDHDRYPYISSVIEEMSKMTDIKGVKLRIDSDIPVGSGLGSSAAVTIATIQALNLLFGCNLGPEDIATLGHSIERKIQGAASPTDTYVSTMGGVVIVPVKKKLNIIDCGIVIGNTGKFSSTRQMVSDVALLKKRYPEMIDPILSTIGRISMTGEELVIKQEYRPIGELMNINQGLLDAISVSGPELADLIYAARSAGAYGAKITGAGGGGCMIALSQLPDMEKVASAITRAGGEAIVTRITEHGVRVEH